MKKTALTVVVACGLALAPAVASAQPPTAPPAKPEPKTAPMQHEQMQGRLTAADRSFVREAAIGGMTEVELGRLASDKASSADVKQFGQRMTDDHGKANDELKAWAQQKNVTLPTELDAKHKATRDRLSKLSGAAFDRAYMNEMVTDHQKDVAAFRKASKTLHEPDLKAWATKTLPTLQDHLKMARKTRGEVVGTSGRGKKPGK